MRLADLIEQVSADMHLADWTSLSIYLLLAH